MNNQLSNPKNRSPTKGESAPKTKKINQLLLRLFRYLSKLIKNKNKPYLAQKTCEIYLGEKDHLYQNKCQQLLQTNILLNPIQVYRFLHTSIGNRLIHWLQRFFIINQNERSQDNEALKNMLVEMTKNRYGVSLFSFLEQIDNDVNLDLETIVQTLQDVQKLVKDTEIILQSIQELAQQQLDEPENYDFSILDDLSRTGTYQVKKQQQTWHINNQYFQNKSVEILIYQPNPLPQHDIPVVIQSHGLGSNPETLSQYAHHLASYGYLVIGIQHFGSDHEYIAKMLSGKEVEIFDLSEFVDRPLLVSSIIDELEKRNQSQWEGRLQTPKIGFMGTSFGAYTGLMLAGAKINFDRLEGACTPIDKKPNLSMLLQCEALKLPRKSYDLRDDRIQALFLLDSFGSEIFGEKGIKDLKIPIMLIAGSHDFVAPLLFEQIRLFQWLESNDNYLVLMKGKSHLPDWDLFTRSIDLQWNTNLIPSLQLTKTNIFTNYIQIFTLAFFDLYLKNISRSQVYLTSNYTHFLQSEKQHLWLVKKVKGQRSKVKGLNKSD